MPAADCAVVVCVAGGCVAVFAARAAGHVLLLLMCDAAEVFAGMRVQLAVCLSHAMTTDQTAAPTSDRLLAPRIMALAAPRMAHRMAPMTLRRTTESGRLTSTHAEAHAHFAGHHTSDGGDSHPHVWRGGGPVAGCGRRLLQTSRRAGRPCLRSRSLCSRSSRCSGPRAGRRSCCQSATEPAHLPRRRRRNRRRTRRVHRRS